MWRIKHEREMSTLREVVSETCRAGRKHGELKVNRCMGEEALLGESLEGGRWIWLRKIKVWQEATNDI